MRKDTSFSERKLSRDEFSEKYWRQGELPYQYHTGAIEDGRDEREQFLFNNARALYNLMGTNADIFRETIAALEKRVDELERQLQLAHQVKE